MSLMRANYSFTLVWTMVFIVFFAYFFITASIVAFEDAFDETINQKGYPNDFQEASKWELEEYIRWTIAWMPEKYQQKVLKKFNSNAEEEADEKS